MNIGVKITQGWLIPSFLSGRRRKRLSHIAPSTAGPKGLNLQFELLYLRMQLLTENSIPLANVLCLVTTTAPSIEHHLA
jgi:hypothetical protein